MTSRQPGAMPPRIAGHAEAPGDGSEKPDGGERADGKRAGAGLTAQDWLVRLLPVVLLIVVGLAGLAANGVRASFLDTAAKQALLAEIDAVAADSPVGGVSAETPA